MGHAQLIGANGSVPAVRELRDVMAVRWTMPGEPLTVAAVAQAVRLLCRERYEVPAQDLSIPLSKLPTLPRSGFVLQRRR